VSLQQIAAGAEAGFPDFTSPVFLRSHIEKIVRFYAEHAVDPAGGFFHCFSDDGTVCDTRGRHLVSSTRFVYLFAVASILFQSDEYRWLARHGLSYLEDFHYSPETGGYLWEIEMPRPDRSRSDDETIYAYGIAFVLLAGATATAAGVRGGTETIERAWTILETKFWSTEYRLYADEYTPGEETPAPYRGQNANMHICEACLAAYEATGEDRFLYRAIEIADAVTRRQTGPTGGLIWEHYHADWTPDFDFHRDKPDDLFRPWGFQPGHHAEWSKLLLQIHRFSSEASLVDRARELFEAATTRGWDDQYGGLYYGFAPDGAITSSDKYYWVQAEAIGAAALLYGETGEATYADWYRRLWEYSWTHFIDHRYGGWFRVLDRSGRRREAIKSPPGKTGYHPAGACLTALEVSWKGRDATAT